VTLAYRLRALVPFAAAAVCVAAAACQSSTSTIAYTPITGIIVRGQGLIPDVGCGLGPDQVYRYAAVVSYPPGLDAVASMGSSGPWSNISECFSDAVFENLPSSTAGDLLFDVVVYAYNFDDYQRAGLPADLGCYPSNSPADACTPAITFLTPAQIQAATWTTTCTATEQAGTPVLAVCLPPEGGPVLDASTDATLDGPDDAGNAVVDAADATSSVVDAPADAPLDAPQESSTDGSVDAGATVGAEPNDG
jgi:hypothetical protein